MANRTRAERRHNDWTKAIRKRKISQEVYYHSPGSYWEYYDNLHQYSKNKIHCSCPICRAKRKDKDRYGKTFSPTASEQRKVDKMNYDTKEIE